MVQETLPREIRSGCSEYLLYAVDLALVSESLVSKDLAKEALRSHSKGTVQPMQTWKSEAKIMMNVLLVVILPKLKQETFLSKYVRPFELTYII